MASTKMQRTLEQAGVDPLWDTKMTATYLGVAEHTLDMWAYRNEGPAFSKVGRRRRYRREDVDRWLAQNRVGGAVAG